MASDANTVVKRARVGPRAAVILTMGELFSNMCAMVKCLVITDIVLGR